MYQILENPRMMTEADIDREFLGKWVFIVNANINNHGKLIEGIPVVTGDYQFDGVEEGIYSIYDSAEYGRQLSYSLIPLDNTISSVFGMGFA